MKYQDGLGGQYKNGVGSVYNCKASSVVFEKKVEIKIKRKKSEQ